MISTLEERGRKCRSSRSVLKDMPVSPQRKEDVFESFYEVVVQSKARDTGRADSRPSEGGYVPLLH